MPEQIPLYARYPALGGVPRISLCTFPSPVQSLSIDGAEIWIKLDGLNTEFCGGNKARSLEFLLAGVRRGDTIVTAGGEGSTHVLATAVHAQRLGARVIGMRWRHEMNPAARRVAARITDECVTSRVYGGAVIAIARAQLERLAQRCRYIPLGGSTPLGTLAHVNAALELAQQINAGELPAPARVVVPLGSGGTVAGLALGFAIAGLDTSTIAVQVTPAIVANQWHVRRLVARTGRLIARITGERVPTVPAHLLGIVRDMYGGAYGRAVPAATSAALELENVTGIRLDDTYSAKAFVVARELARRAAGPTLFWDTFDSRLL
ncbi:MAG: 1-aminocyclopropane-1-carboxylate deaminase/D-cysteine desulfhydrase [Gemmatimonadales bacterium]